MPTFTDKESTAVRHSLIYDTGSLKGRLAGYITSSLPTTANTSATQRMGKFVSRTFPVPKVTENSDTGGVRLGSVTVFQNGEPADQIDMTTFDAFRSGKNIKNYNQFAGAKSVRPMIRISPEGFFDVEADGHNVINHLASFNNLGMGQGHKTVDEEFKLIPFFDFNKLIPAQLLGKEFVPSSYPFVHNDTRNFDQYLDPSSPGLDGAVDVFEVRHALSNLSTSDIRVYGCHGDYQGGGIENNRKGSTTIDSKYELKVKSCGLFLDSQETEFVKFSFPKIGVTGSSGYKFPLPGFIDDSKYTSSPFDESVDYLTGSYPFKTSAMANFLTSSRNSISEIGTRFKSTTCGLIYGESNVLGTDSIAFGGLKK